MKSFKPINIIQMPNHFHEMDFWNIKFNQQQTISLRLFLTDGLGERRYTPPEINSTIKLRFMRARNYAVSGYDSVDQTFDVNGSFEGLDRSIAVFNLTKEQSKQIYPGTVLVILTENSSSETIKQNFILKIEKNTGGC